MHRRLPLGEVCHRQMIVQRSMRSTHGRLVIRRGEHPRDKQCAGRVTNPDGRDGNWSRTGHKTLPAELPWMKFATGK